MSASDEKGTIKISNSTFSQDIHFSDVKVIVNQYESMTGTPLEDEAIRDDIARATELTRNGDYLFAIPILEQIAEKAPLPAVYDNLGALYALTGDQRARQAYGKAIEHDPEFAPAQVNMALLNLREGEPGKTRLQRSA